jgi:TolB protein
MLRKRIAGWVVLAAAVIGSAVILQGCTEDKLDVYATGTLDGTVMDFTSEEYLNGVILTTNPPTVSVASDSVGYFIFNDLNVGDYNLIARKNGYISESVSISVKREKTTSVVVILERSSEYNDPPVFTGDFYPANGETVQAIDITLSWNATDPNPNDTIHYDVKVFESDEEEGSVHTGLSESTLLLEQLRFNTVYFWQVTAYDAFDSVQSELLSFRTASLPDNVFLYTAIGEDGNYEIFSSDSLGSTRMQLTRNFKDDWQPRFDPESNVIAYISHDQLEPHIYTMERDGSNVKKITSEPVAGYHNSGRGFTWSPAGTEIIYAHYNHMLFSNISVNVHGKYATAPEDRHFRDMDYSPNKAQIVAQTVGIIEDSSEIYLYNLNETEPVLLVPNLPGIIESPSFSVDGTKVMFTRDVSEGILPGRQLNAHIFIIDIGTGVVTDISVNKPTGTNDLNPRFSPNGAHIIFENGSNELNAPRSIWIMDITGSNRRMLFENAYMPEWG